MFLTALPERRTIAGMQMELLAAGSGPPLLFLHGGHGIDAGDPLVAQLARRFQVFAPSMPGFGATERPAHVTSADDVAYAMLDLIDDLGLRELAVVGVSFGGWVAAELATKGSERIASLTLIDPIGAKFGDRDTPDITDIYGYTNDQIPALFFADEAKGLAALHGLAFKDLPEEAALRFARNREALTLFGWAPILHNPKLRTRLHRIKVPTLVLWGGEDRIVSPDYGRQFAAAIPDSRFECIEGVGHYGYFEQPETFAEKVVSFVGA